jgi:hypothetical protein
MFDRFRAEYAHRRDDTLATGSAWQNERLAGVEGYVNFASEFAGDTFCGGLYRVHDDQSGPRSLAVIADAFPDFAARVCPFSFDWLGRQFAIDSSRVEGGQPLVLLLDPGAGDALEIPQTFTTFHEEELIDFVEAALAVEFFEEWSAANSASLPLQRDQCVGYRVPLFLGGQDLLENLELGDLEVYWSLCGQLRLRTRSLPPGTSINTIRGL